MTISGYLETFSLPELFQLIQSGNKSGRLTFNLSFNNNVPELKGNFKLWFKQGNFIAIINSLRYSFLIDEIKKNNWLDYTTLLQTKFSRPPNKALGDYIQQEKLLTSSQIDLLFQSQLDKASKLFNVNSAWFSFEEIDLKGQVSSDGEEFPWEEMTGKQKKATELSLEAMRSLSDWSHFVDKMPLAESGLQKLVSDHNLKLTYLENNLWNAASSSTSLQEISQKLEVSLEIIQQTALALIFAELVEEIPVIKTARKKQNVSNFSTPTSLVKQGNGTNKNSNTKASKSLINNLVSFLRNKV